jgi:hypothetical protein
MGRRLVLHAFALLVVLSAAATARAADFDASDTLLAIDQASAATGVARSWLHSTVGCETGWTFSPDAIGDHGTSFGAAQLHRGGELGRFYLVGFEDPFNPYESILFMAQQFAAGRAFAWSCS